MLGFVLLTVAVALAFAALVAFGAGRNRKPGDDLFALDWFHVPFEDAIIVRNVRRSAWGRPRRR